MELSRYVVTGVQRHSDGYREDVRMLYKRPISAFKMADRLENSEVFDLRLLRTIHETEEEKVRRLHRNSPKAPQQPTQEAQK